MIKNFQLSKVEFFEPVPRKYSLLDQILLEA